MQFICNQCPARAYGFLTSGLVFLMLRRRDVTPRSVESLRVDIAAQSGDCGVQQETQSKHPLLSRPGQPYSSPSQRSLSQECPTQSQNTQQFSQNSQPEDYGCDLVSDSPLQDLRVHIPGLITLVITCTAKAYKP